MDYLKESAKTASGDFDKIKARLSDESTVNLLHAALGLATEAAEIADALKKHIYYGKPLDKVNLAEEIGDQMWYCAIVARELGLTFEQIQETNIQKLKARYGEKFTEEAAVNRNLDKEREILETSNK